MLGAVRKNRLDVCTELVWLGRSIVLGGARSPDVEIA